MSNSSEIVLDVDHVWKVYCRNLKRAMWYGLRDLGRELTSLMLDGPHARLDAIAHLRSQSLYPV